MNLKIAAFSVAALGVAAFALYPRETIYISDVELRHPLSDCIGLARVEAHKGYQEIVKRFGEHAPSLEYVTRCKNDILAAGFSLDLP